MKEILNNTPEVKVNPKMEIMALRQQIQQEGNVDSELNAFTFILENIEKKIITPEEGLDQAKHIIERRQSYH